MGKLIVPQRKLIRPTRRKFLKGVAAAGLVTAACGPAIARGPIPHGSAASGITPPPRTQYPAAGPVLDDKAYVITTPSQTLEANVEGWYAGSSGANGAVIRDGSVDLTIDNFWAHDNQSGVLVDLNVSGSLPNSCTMTNSRTERNGSNLSAAAHGIYNAAINFTITNSCFYSPLKQSHLVKTRGENNTFTKVITAQLWGWGSRCYDFDGRVGSSLTTGTWDKCVMQIGPGGDNAGGPIIQFAPNDVSGIRIPVDMTFTNTIFISDDTRAAAYVAFCYNSGTITFGTGCIVIGNFQTELIYDHTDGVVSPPTIVGEAGVTRYASRAAAIAGGVDIAAAYNAAENCIPWPVAWGTRPDLWDIDTAFPPVTATMTLFTPASVISGRSVQQYLTPNGTQAMGYGIDTIYGPSTVRVMSNPITSATDFSAEAIGRINYDAVTNNVVINGESFDINNLDDYWNEIPGTSINSVIAAAGQNANVFYAWGSACWTGSGFIIARQGGHTNWADNYVYGFSDSTLAWSRLRDTDAIAGHSVQNWPVMVDDKPEATQNYGGVQWIDAVSKMLITSGAFPYEPYTAGPELPLGNALAPYYYDPATNDYVLPGGTAMNINTICGYDAVRGLVMGMNGNGDTFTVWDPVGETVVGTCGVPTYSSWGNYSQGAYSPDHKMFVFPSYSINLLNMFDLTDPAHPVFSGVSMDSTTVNFNGYTWSPMSPLPAAIDMLYPGDGIVYHPPSQKFACLGGRDGLIADVIWFDPDAITLTRQVTPVNLPFPQKPPLNDSRMFGRWQYDAGRDVFWGQFVPGVNMWIYKPVIV